jgi:hypothetical protein
MAFCCVTVFQIMNQDTSPGKIFESLVCHLQSPLTQKKKLHTQTPTLLHTIMVTYSTALDETVLNRFLALPQGGKIQVSERGCVLCCTCCAAVVQVWYPPRTVTLP